ncbi:MAG: penicillin-binding protein, partial [Desulfobacterales bacterium]|nr:penicillin-binding protein [Desulfobacterales bacterium]
MIKPVSKRKLRILFFAFLFFCISITAAIFMIYIQVSREAGDRIDRGIIDSIIFSESPVYYDDGKSVMGVFFDKTHRKYIHYEDIPPYFIKALIATEDRNYFNHPGFDPKAVLRALFANIKRGKIVQGGSTITQQTAKNIFKRERRSFKTKIKELVQALLLERKYTKEDILEMYVNQFFVTGFGRGLRIAAQYFFDKEAEDLDLVEAAFIAGSVKSPNRYNPFTKKSDAERGEARRLSKLRKDFVLANMFKMNFIAEDQYLKAKAREVPFNEGRVTYALNVILDYVREQLESDFFRAVLEREGVDNISTSGIKIYTSVNKEIQEGALNSIRRHLPLLDVKLTGYGSAPMKQGESRSPENDLKKQEGTLPFLCRITHIQAGPKNPQLIVAWNSGGGIIDYEGFRAIGEAWLRGR